MTATREERIRNLMRQTISEACEIVLMKDAGFTLPTIWDWLLPWRALRWQRRLRADLADYIVKQRTAKDKIHAAITQPMEDVLKPTFELHIRWRCDQEEVYCTDDTTVKVKDWAEVIHHIRQIEDKNTVLSVERLNT